MDAKSLVVGSQAVTIALFILVAVSWSGWFVRNWRDLMTNAIGLLAFGFIILAFAVAYESAYYGAARLLKWFEGINLWEDDAAPYAIAAQKLVMFWPALVLSLISRWRIANLPSDAIQVRVITLAIGSMCLFALVVGLLW